MTETQGFVENVSTILNKQIANWSVLFVKLHHFHWYVKGPDFFTLHAKFEELYEEAHRVIDQLAERLLALGGKPVSTMKGWLELASIPEAQGEQTAEEMVRELIKDFETIVAETKKGIAALKELGDEGTSDMLLDLQQSLEKHLWMLRAFLA